MMTFGTDDKQAEFFARYGTASYEETGAAIAQAQSRIAETPVRLQQAPRINRASEKAVDYLVALSLKVRPDVAEYVVRTWAAMVDRSVVSEKIDELKALPVATAARTAEGSLERHNVPAGRYAVTGNDGQTVFVKIDRPTEGQWKGRIFVKVQAGDDEMRCARSVADALLGKIAAAGVQEAMLRYGREIGSCGHCGRTLTNEESRVAGIGPVCREKLGW